ncbi:putative indole-3-pyruvate monooxygenase [Helianthus debilis subsp. tardiflorus]
MACNIHIYTCNTKIHTYTYKYITYHSHRLTSAEMSTGVEETVVIIVGAGPSGLATAACLHQLSIPYIVLEREDCLASLFNKKTYNRLHLHLAKTSVNFLTFLFRRFAKYEEDEEKWKVEAEVDGGGVKSYEGRFLVVATGETSDVYIPEVDGLSEFKGEVIHSTDYKSGKGYENKKVLVVGAGNSGMEIALDLSNFGAKTSIVVRSPVSFSLLLVNYMYMSICFFFFIKLSWSIES